jgi:hypothetical protein
MPDAVALSVCATETARVNSNAEMKKKTDERYTVQKVINNLATQQGR